MIFLPSVQNFVLECLYLEQINFYETSNVRSIILALIIIFTHPISFAQKNIVGFIHTLLCLMMEPNVV